MAPWRRQFTQAAINQNEALQNTAVYWEEEVWSYPTYAIQMSKEQLRSVHLRNQHWYLSNWDNKGTYFTLGLPLPDVDSHNGSIQGKAPHEYKDIPIFAEYHMSSRSKEEDLINKQICWSPVNLSMTVQAISAAPHPIEDDTVMLIATAITTQVQSNPIPGGAGPSGGGGGGPPGGGGGAPGRGGGGAPGGGNPNQPSQGDRKPMGTLPTIFEGDHSKAESFLWEFSTYLLVNYNVPALTSFIKRIAIALTCIKGPEVNWWTQQQLEWLMTLQPADDNNNTYQQFITNFRAHFMDSQKAQRARIKLQTLKMTWPEIDEYISKFKSIAHEASYNPADPNTMQQFLQGLPQSIGQKVLEDTTVETYEQMKKKAINVTASQCIIHALYKQPPRNTTPWNNFQTTWQMQRQCFQGNQNPQPQRQGFSQTPFNSTTAPKSWNNQPVPMDLDQTRAPRGNWRGWGRGSQRGNVARVEDTWLQRGIQGACFNCGEQGHFAHNCPTKQKHTNMHTVQLIVWSPEDNKSNSGTTMVDSIYQQLNVLPKDDQEELMTRLGAQEGNFSEA